MKKLYSSALCLSLAMAGATVGLTSCSQNEPEMPTGDGLVSFRIELPSELNSRFADGKKVTKVFYSVFTADGEKLVLNDEKVWPAQQLSTTVDIQLVPTETYRLVFFAVNEQAIKNGAYSYDPTTAAFSVDYTKVVPNEDLYDAFKYADQFTVGTSETTIPLKRPFAQVNIGTDDLESKAVQAYGLNNYSSTFTIQPTGLLSGINFNSGVPVAQAADKPVKFDIANFSNLPGDVMMPEQPQYKYLEMNYLLVDPAVTPKTLLEATYTIYGKSGNQGPEVNKLTLSNMPVLPNYQTNIYGSLLTTVEQFTLEIKPAFTPPAFDLKQWDGSIAPVPAPDADNNISISTPSQFAGVAAAVNENSQAFRGKTITLTEDLDLSNIEWTPIGDIARGKHFEGTFDGNGHTIKNLNVSAVAEGSGLFGALQGKVQNLVLEDVNITGHHWAGAVAGYCTDNAGTAVSNVTVNNANISIVPHLVGGKMDDGDKAGGVIGYISVNNPVTNCTVNNSFISGFRDVGGICGMSDIVPTGCQVNNTTIELNGIVNDPGHTLENIGQLVGRGNGRNANNVAGSSSNITFQYANFNSDEFPVGYNPGSITNVAAVVFKNMNLQSIQVNIGNIPVTFDGCTFTALGTESPTGSNRDYRFGIFYVAGNGATDINLTVKNCTFASSWSHGVYVQGNSETVNNNNCVLNFTGNSFADWGKKETAASDIATSAAVKLNRCGVCQTEEARAAYAQKFIADNTFSEATLATGRVCLNMTANVGGQATEYTFK